MYELSKSSEAKLKTCDHHLIILYNCVLKYRPFVVTCGFRTSEEQIKLLKTGRSKVREGKHNITPSQAVDAYPIINGKISFDSIQCYGFIHFVLGVAACLNTKVRSGMDWDGDFDLHDQNFNDIGHVELIC